MKPITYWLQNGAIDQLVEQFGDYLQALTVETRRDLIVCLAQNDCYKDGKKADLDAVWALIGDLNRYEQDLLMQAIAASIVHSENPWLDMARKLSQKEGIPSP